MQIELIYMCSLDKACSTVVNICLMLDVNGITKSSQTASRMYVNLYHNVLYLIYTNIWGLLLYEISTFLMEFDDTWVDDKLKLVLHHKLQEQLLCAKVYWNDEQHSSQIC